MPLIRTSVGPESAATRLDVFLSGHVGDCSRSMLQKLIKDSRVRVDGEICTLPRLKLDGGERIVVDLPEAAAPEQLVSEDLPLDVIYQDDWLLVVNKAPGVSVHPGAGRSSGTLVNALIHRYPQLGEPGTFDPSRPGLVHRLDKDTSGCLVVAKTPQALYKISRSFAERKVRKEYLAVCCGTPKQPSGVIETLIGRHKVNRKKMAVLDRGGKNAVTLYKVLASSVYERRNYSLLSLEIKTGRTHQIRVHMSYLNCPVAGDQLYGGARFITLPRQMLHAWKLSFAHPADQRQMDFCAPLPDDFADAVCTIGLQR